MRPVGLHDVVVGLHAFADERVALQLALRPASKAGPAEAQEHRIVAIVDPRTGEVIGRAVTDPSGASCGQVARGDRDALADPMWAT